MSQSFDQINALSDLPETVEVEINDGGGDVAIDTGPAQRAIMESEVTDRPDPDPATISATEQRVQPPLTGASSTPVSNVVAERDVQTPVVGPAFAPATPQQTIAKTGDSVNILLMGVDARPGEAIDVGVRPDSLSVLHLDPATGSCRILGIPRDTRTDLPGYGLSKINHALAVGGVPYQELVVENLLGIEIDHYGLVDFAGVVGVVDAVGGITVDNPEAFSHQGFEFASGSIRLDGEMALAYSRYRYDAGGDFARIDRQQQVIRAILTEVSPEDAVRLIPQLMGDLESHFKTDYSMTDLVGLLNQYGDTCTAATLETQSLQGTVATYPDPLFKMDLSYVIVEPAETEAGVAWLLTGDAQGRTNGRDENGASRRASVSRATRVVGVSMSVVLKDPEFVRPFTMRHFGTS